MNIRYKINPKTDSFGLGQSLDDPKDTIEVKFDHKTHIYFVDILESKRPLIKIKIYMPNGEILQGWQMSNEVVLHHVGNVFDGRFNVR